MVPLSHYLILSAVLFTLGVIGVLLRRNVIIIFMSIELMLNGANLTLVAFSRFYHTLDGQILAFFVMTVAAAEAAVGLVIIISIYRHKQSLDVDEVNLLRL